MTRSTAAIVALSAAMIVALAVAGCRPRPMSAAEVAGRWLVSDAKGLNAAKAHGEASLDFRPDGSFVALHIPYSGLGDLVEASPDLTGSGSWRIDQLEGREMVALNFAEIGGRPQP